MQKTEITGSSYQSHIATKAPTIVDVHVPSGFVFKFEKPSKFSMLFAAGSLPQSAVAEAVSAWEKDGVFTPTDAEGGESNQLKLIKTALDMRDRVLRLSHLPKLVVGPAKDESELSTDDVADEDLEFLFRWVAAGGEASQLSTFPGGSQQRPLASASRKKQRVKAK